ncbi:MAG: tetratricopeptide repeat protein [Candidatus Cloacimonadaceae bacterium]|nr:tetratricopeptide repeat protein [Candidatus Cloacimonadaceae bacterium]MDP3115265.1 tetratricopeptide repeat protein [Candidatus Cloacimonadaceae bacterium]
MLRYIPAYILNRFEAKVNRGALTAYVLLFDIADFTVIGTALQKEGKPGAEELSRLLDVVFGTPVEIVNRFGGFVSGFAGDAFCTIFPEANATDVVSAVNAIRAFFKDKPIFQTPWGDFNLKVRQTVCYGELHWQIFSSELQNEYAFYGETMKELAALSHQKKDVAFSENAANKLGLEHFTHQTTGYSLLDKEISSNTVPFTYHYQAETRDMFVHARFRNEQPQNEIRSGGYCFANLENIEPENREHAISVIQNLADKYGGFVNKYDATDKGLIGIILFGIPRSEDKTLDRICRFALKAVESIPKLALGIASGNVFAGYTGSGDISEYTALGHPMNLAARLMGKASAGEVLTDHYLYLESHNAYEFQYISSIELKGISTPIRNYRLSKKVYDQSASRENSFVGRESESAFLNSSIDGSLSAPENTIIYVMGDAGIGKSRLIRETLLPYSDEECLKFFCYCDAILQKSLEPIKQIIRSYFGFSYDSALQEGIASFRQKMQSFAGSDPELQRIESILASLLGYEWQDSIWDMLPAPEKPAQLQSAFLQFMREITRQKPVLIHLDDAQWLDAQSMEFLQLLSEQETGTVVIIAACRFLDDGSKPDLGLSRYRSLALDLGTLSEMGSRQLIQSVLGLKNLPENTFREINNHALGNPFFLEQLVSYLSENGKLDSNGEISGEIGILSSFSISDIIGSRIDRLTVSLRELVSSASILGMEFNVNVLSQMLNNNPVEMLYDGTAHRIWKDLDALRYIFSHILIKDVVYQRMLSEKLTKLHLTAAEALESVYTDSLAEHAEEIALHYAKSDQSLIAAKYYNLAGCFNRAKYDLEGGEAALQKALHIRENLLGDRHPDTISSLTDLAEVYFMRGDFALVEPMAIRALETREQVLGKTHPDTIQALLNLAEIYHGQGKYTIAEPLFLQALELRTTLLGTEHSDVAYILNNLGLLYGYQGRFEQAEPFILKALEIRVQVFGSDHRYTAESLQNMARLYSEQGKLDLVEPLCLKALAINEKVLGAEHPATADVLDNLGFLYMDMANYLEAEPCLFRALDIRKKVLGTEHPDTATSMGSLANLYHYQGLYLQAEPLYRRMLEIYEKFMGTDHPETAIALNNLANNLDLQGETDLAETLYQRALAIQSATLDEDSPALANTLDNLAVMYGNKQQFEEAEPLYQRALAIRMKALGSEHPATAGSLANLAFMYQNMGRNKEAEPLLLKALIIREASLGTYHPQTIQILEALVELNEKLGNQEKAKEFQAKIDLTINKVSPSSA